jgi:hypothetical protein
VEGHGVRPWPQSTPSVPSAFFLTRPAGFVGGPVPARAPAHGRAALPPLALGGAGGHALTTTTNTVSIQYLIPSNF